MPGQEKQRSVRLHLIQARKDAGLSQDELAGLAGTQQGYISQLEWCERNPGRRLAKRIAQILNKDDGHLFDEGIVTLEEARERGFAA